MPGSVGSFGLGDDVIPGVEQRWRRIAVGPAAGQAQANAQLRRGLADSVVVAGVGVQILVVDDGGSAAMKGLDQAELGG